MEFPRLVYKLQGKYQRQGGTFDYHLVSNEAEYKAALSSGWLSSMDAKEEVIEEDNSPATRAELETKAKELGLKFDGRTSDAKLNTMIATALGAK